MIIDNPSSSLLEFIITPAKEDHMGHYSFTIKGGQVIIFEEWYPWDGKEKLLFRLRRLPRRSDCFLLWYGRNDSRNKVGTPAELLPSPDMGQPQNSLRQLLELTDVTPDKIMALFPDSYQIKIDCLNL